MMQLYVLMFIALSARFNTYAAASDNIPQACSHTEPVTVAASAMQKIDNMPTAIVENYTGKILLLTFKHHTSSVHKRIIYPCTEFCTWPTMFDYLELAEFNQRYKPDKPILVGTYAYAHVAEPTMYIVLRDRAGKLILYRGDQELPCHYAE